jgi:LPXTG-motif cell wall-anchored protein
MRYNYNHYHWREALEIRMVRHRSKGSVIGFIIVGVLLLGLVAGAIYAVKRGVFNGVTKPTEVARQTPASENKDTPQSDANKSTQPSAEQKKADELSAALKKQAEAEKKAKEQSQAASNQPSTTQPSTQTQPSASSQNSTTASKSSSTPATIPQTGVSLPQTGPAENAIVTTLGLSLLAGAIVAYRRSRALI